jgi:hypothetical protein
VAVPVAGCFGVVALVAKPTIVYGFRNSSIKSSIASGGLATMTVSNNVFARLTSLLAVGLLATAAVFVEGCGPAKGEVKGKITYKGVPVGGGSVTIQSAKGSIHTGEISSDGSYVVKGVPMGPAKLAVGWVDNSAVERNVAMLKGKRDAKEVAKPGEARPTPAETQKLPAKYGDLEQSGLTVEVKGSVTEYNIELKD